MERRRTRRMKSSLTAALFPGGERPAGIIKRDSGGGVEWYKFAGTIENLSGDGILVRVSSSGNGLDHSSGSLHKVKFQLLTKEMLDIYCEVVWAGKILLQDFGTRKGIDPLTEYTVMGMKLRIPSSDYKKFYKNRISHYF